MKLPAFCIHRPVFATVLSLILVLIGIMGFQHLQTRFFPRFESNKIFISTQYPSASAKLVEKSITTPLEKAIGGIAGVDFISSVSTQGSSSITVELQPSVNVYEVTNKIRNQIALASSQLPSSIQSPIIHAGHGAMDLIDMGFSIDDNHLNHLRDYLDRTVINRIEQLPGISTVSVMGANKYAMRITLHPDEMTAQHVTLDNISQAISNSNLQLPAGFIHTPSMDFPITADTALHSANEFGNIVVKTVNGQPIYLKDIATVTLGNDTAFKSYAHINGKPGILLSIYNADDANPIVAAAHVRSLLKSIETQMPSTIHAAVTFDQSTYMKDSISEVYKTISIATLFVAIIIFLSLGSIRSAFIPIVTIPVCIVSTMGFMYFFGFSINMITLLAIVLSIGLVVDDAIVVLENIARHVESGLSRLDAAIKGSQEIATPIIAMTLTLAAVYAPIGLIKGPVTHIFASFAFTLAISVIVSGFVALTLSPMMCSKWLANTHFQKNYFAQKIASLFHSLTQHYQSLLTLLLAHRLKIVLSTLVFATIGLMIASTLPKTFLPNEDLGFVITMLNTNTGSNNQFSQTQLQKISQILNKNKNIKTNVSISFQQDDDNVIFSTLHDYKYRAQTANQIATRINTYIKTIPGLNAIAFAPSFGGSTHNQLAFYIMAPESYRDLYHTANTLIARLKQYPGLVNLQSNIQFNDQQYTLTVNRDLANTLQVSIRTIDNTIAELLGGTTVSTFNLNGQTYDVDVQAEQKYLQSVAAILQFTVPSATGQLVPLSNLITMTPVLTQSDLYHYNQLRSAMISAELAPGYSLGTVVNYLQKALPTLLPKEVKYAFTGQAQRVLRSGSSMLTIFLLAFVFIFLVLSAQFESFIDPFIILLAVPLSIIGALLSLKCVNGSINLYTVIGLVTLVGLIAKHGILITQFANTLKKEGKSVHEALIEAASIRLRPILMTTAAMICGALPLVFASGASAVSREQVGVVFVGGLLFGTFFSLVLVPVAYSYFSQRSCGQSQ